MDELLPHYERELAFLREDVKGFAAQYPKVAGRLQLATGVAEDPHVERLIQSFALLAARVHKRLDDDFPLVTESLLDVLYPHYLRPFPSCSIAQFELGASAAQMSAAAVVPRGTMLSTRPVRGVACKFRTAYPLQLTPVRMVDAGFRNAVGAPDGTRLPQAATSVISLELELTSPLAGWNAVGDHLRVYLDGEPSQVSALREALCDKVAAVMVQTEPHGAWVGASSAARPRLVGFGDDEALIDYDDRSHPAYRLLTEYFAFPDKFNFVDLPLPLGLVPNLRDESQRSAGGPSRVTLHLVLAGPHSDSDQARLLESISADSFALGCTPIVNLFQQNADPIRVSHTAARYPVVVDARKAYAYELYSVDRVFRVKQTPYGDSVDEFRPFFSLCHDDVLAARVPGESRAGRYWHVQRNEAVAASSPGYEVEMSIVDIDFEPAAPQVDTLSVQVTATNRDLPSQLGFGVPGGDLFVEGGSVAREIRMLRKPTATHRLRRKRGNLWRLVSHLSLNHLSLSGRGVDALKEMLRLYDLPHDAANQRQIEGVSSIEYAPGVAWLAGEPFATIVRGTDVRVVVDESSFVGTGLHLFANVLDRFLGLYVHVNSFTRLTIVSARTRQPLITCPPRNGATALV